MNSQEYCRTWSSAHPVITIHLILLFFSPFFSSHRKLIPIKDLRISSPCPWWFSICEGIRKETIEHSFLCLTDTITYSAIRIKFNGAGDSAFTGNWLSLLKKK